MTLTDVMAEKVHDLLEQNRVTLVVGYEGQAAIVAGATAWYTVKATRHGITCECQAAAGMESATCSHAIAAMVAWAEAAADPFSGVSG
jgi:hypothetical protein